LLLTSPPPSPNDDRRLLDCDDESGRRRDDAVAAAAIIVTGNIKADVEGEPPRNPLVLGLGLPLGEEDGLRPVGRFRLDEVSEFIMIPGIVLVLLMLLVA
jgi:hypothetical protein